MASVEPADKTMTDNEMIEHIAQILTHGMIKMKLVRRRNLPRMLIGATLGDPTVTKWLTMCEKAMDEVLQRPVCCLMCETQFTVDHPPELLAFVHRDEVEFSMTQFICEKCVVPENSEMGRIIWNNLLDMFGLPKDSVVGIHHMEGHA